MSASETSKIVAEFLDGNAALASAVYAMPQEELRKSVAGRELVLTKQAVIRVLRDLRAGRVAPRDVQRWASFVRRGFAAPAQGPLVPLDVDYDPRFEDDIVEAVGRMDEIGDVVDGRLTPDEIDEHLVRLDGQQWS